MVDGKQRLETIFAFANNRIRLAADFGDARLNGRRWKDLANEQDLKYRFWNYQLPVEMIDIDEGDLIQNVFDRLNRNSRRLTPQELRHAKFEGWFITKAEQEAEAEEWRTLGITTRARSSRMTDVQFISELMAVVLRGRPLGFGQDELSEIYAEFDDLDEHDDFSEDNFDERFNGAKLTLLAMEDAANAVTTWAKGFGDRTPWFYVVSPD